MSTLVVQNLSLGVGGLPNGSVTTDDLADGAVTTDKIAAGAVATVDLADAAVTAAKMSGAQSGSAPVYGARAWVNFQGTGTVTIRSSGNVSSITDNAVGDYTVNFTTAMPNATYAWLGTAVDGGTSAPFMSTPSSGAYSTTQLRVKAWTYNGSAYDTPTASVAVFG